MKSLRIIGALYLLSGLWCAFRPELAAGFLGIAFTSSTGEAEFFSVYGGLQVGIGGALITSSMIKHYLEGAFFFSAILSSGLLFFRLGSIVIYGFGIELFTMVVLEAFIAILLWFGWHQKRLLQHSE